MGNLWNAALCRAVLMASAVLWWTPQEANAQVSVVNGGFESFQSLPDASGQFHLVNGWANGGSDVAIPDYYHQLGSNGGDLPQTPLAKVDAYAGRGIAGFVAFTDEASPRHEYLTGSFSEPLVEGQRYNMRFAISSGRVHDWVNAGLGVSGLGVVFTTTLPAQQGHDALPKQPQFEIHEALYHRDWREVSFVFTATMPFEHFTLGLFEDEPMLRREETGTRTVAYYFVDEFVIEEVSNELMSAEQEGRGTRGTPVPPGVYVPNSFTPNGDLVNDAWVWAVPDAFEGELSVFNRWGHVVWQGQFEENGTLAWSGEDLNGAPCDAGVYGWRLSSQEGVEGQTEWKGWVNVIR